MAATTHMRTGYNPHLARHSLVAPACRVTLPTRRILSAYIGVQLWYSTGSHIRNCRVSKRLSGLPSTKRPVLVNSSDRDSGRLDMLDSESSSPLSLHSWNLCVDLVDSLKNDIERQQTRQAIANTNSNNRADLSQVFDRFLT